MGPKPERVLHSSTVPVSGPSQSLVKGMEVK
jgi:hypothetical protein